MTTSLAAPRDMPLGRADADVATAAMTMTGDQMIAAIRQFRAEHVEMIDGAADDSRALELAQEVCARQVARDEAAVAVGAFTWE